MNEGTGWSLLDYFAELPDPRVARSRRHSLLDIITIALCAAICGADSWVHVELFGKSKREWFETFLELPNGIPSHDTFGSVFSRLDPERFRDCFVAWTQAIAQLLPGEVVAVDGKTARRSHDRPAGKGALHLVSAWASGNGLTLGQVKTAAKSNEITAIPRLLELLELKGAIVTIDAMGCQPAIAQAIVARGADSRLAVKENRPTLYADLQELFPDGAPATDYATTLNKGHGRVERRECWTLTDPASLAYLQERQSWPGLQAVVKVTGQRDTPAGRSAATRYYLSSRAAPAAQLLAAARSHWSIENSLHWSLDVTFREDQCRVRKGHGAQNLATLRQMAHNLLRRENTLKTGIQGKRLNAGWREDYLLKVLLS